MGEPNKLFHRCNSQHRISLCLFVLGLIGFKANTKVSDECSRILSLSLLDPHLHSDDFTSSRSLSLFFFKYLIYQKYVIHLEFWRAFPIFTLKMSDSSEKWFCSGLVCACYVHVRFVSGDVRKYYHYSSSVCCCLSVKHLQCFLVIPGEKTHTHSS